MKHLPACCFPTEPCPPAGSPGQPCLALQQKDRSHSPRSRMTSPSWKTLHQHSCYCCDLEHRPGPCTLGVLEAQLQILLFFHFQVLLKKTIKKSFSWIWLRKCQFVLYFVPMTLEATCWTELSSSLWLWYSNVFPDVFISSSYWWW